MASLTETTFQSEPKGDGQGVTESSRIDASVASPVLLLTGLSIVWLLVASALQLILAWKLHAPSFLADCEWFTYGRVEAAQGTAFLYGWATTAGLAFAAWVSVRLARSETCGSLILSVAGLFWTVGVALAVLGALAGDGTGLRYLEVPKYAAPLLFIAFAIIAAWIIQSIKVGKSPSLYISQWYVIAGVFCFAWLFSVAQVALLFAPVRGTLQSVVQSWFAGGFFLLWLVPVGLSVLYYLLPKLGGRPVNTYYLGVHGFWWLLAVGGFVGVGSLSGGPVPAWIQAAGVAGGLMLLIPAFAIIFTLVSSLSGALAGLSRHVSGKFLIVAIASLVVSMTWTAVAALPSVAAVSKFTLAAKALSGVGAYGFVSMSLFAAIYYYAPKLVGSNWSIHGLVDVHFWASLLGLVLTTACLMAVGFQQASAFADSKTVVHMALSSNTALLFAASCGTILTTIGHISFFLGFVGLVAKTRPSFESRSDETSLEVTAR